MSNDDLESVLDVLVVLVSAMTATLERLDTIAERVADVAVFAEALYAENMHTIRTEEQL